MAVGVWWWMKGKVKRLDYYQLTVLDVSGWFLVNVKICQRLLIKNK